MFYLKRKSDCFIHQLFKGHYDEVICSFYSIKHKI